MNTAAIQGVYNWPLVVLSVIAGVGFSYMGLTLLARRMNRAGGCPPLCLLATGGALGLAVWSLHFLGMLAYRTPFPVHYDIATTLISLAVATSVCTGAVFLMTQQSLPLYRWAGGGLALGMGISSMHYLGMAAMETEPVLEYDLPVVALSVLIAVLAAWVALIWLFYRPENPLVSTPRVRLTAASFLGAAIAAMHYTAMAAVVFIPLDALNAHPSWPRPAGLASCMTIAAFVILVPLLAVPAYKREDRPGDGVDNWLRASIVVGLSFAVGMVLFSQWLVGKMEQRALGFYYLDEEMNQQVMLAEQWRHTLQYKGDIPDIDRRIRGHIDRALRLANVALGGGFHHGRYLHAVDDSYVRHKIVGYKSQLLAWRESLPNRRDGRGARRLPMPTIDLSRLSRDDELEITRLSDGFRLFIGTLNGAVVAILIAIFAGLYLIYGRGRRLMADKNNELQLALDEIRSQRAAVDHHAIVSVTDARGIISYVNDKFLEITQYSAEELLGRRHDVLRPNGYDDGFYRRLWETIERGGHWHGEIEMRRKDGSRCWTDTTIVPFVDSSGSPYKYISISSDITGLQVAKRRLKELNERLEERVATKVRELRQTQEQLLQSEKLAAIGQLAAGVAHEINTPVGYVTSNVSVLKTYVRDIRGLLGAYEQLESACPDGRLKDMVRQLKDRADIEYLRRDMAFLIDESLEGLGRVKRIVRDLKDFSHSDSGEWRRCDIHAELDRTLNIMHNELKHKAEVIKDYGKIPAVTCIPSQLNQVFMNLLVNGVQAIEMNGRITIRTGTGVHDDVWVEVEDTGAGIPEENLTRLFDPFFTTKPVGQGTGLGLALTYGIIKRHHGRVEVHSKVGQGSRFRIWLPVHRHGAASEHPAKEEDAPA